MYFLLTCMLLFSTLSRLSNEPNDVLYVNTHFRLADIFYIKAWNTNVGPATNIWHHGKCRLQVCWAWATRGTARLCSLWCFNLRSSVSFQCAQSPNIRRGQSFPTQGSSQVRTSEDGSQLLSGELTRQRCSGCSNPSLLPPTLTRWCDTSSAVTRSISCGVKLELCRLIVVTSTFTASLYPSPVRGMDYLGNVVDHTQQTFSLLFQHVDKLNNKLNVACIFLFSLLLEAHYYGFQSSVTRLSVNNCIHHISQLSNFNLFWCHVYIFRTKKISYNIKV